MKKCDCEYKGDCPLWTGDMAGRLDHFFIIKYCQGDKTQCTRWKLRINGEKVPAKLLPNGMYFSHWLQNEALIF